MIRLKELNTSCEKYWAEANINPDDMEKPENPAEWVR